MSAFVVFALACFASGFASRLVDPLVLPVAMAFGVSPSTSAMMNVAFALPYAAAQPFLGPLGDRLGKDRCIQICITGLAITVTASTFATSFALLIGSRIVAGLFAAGLTPLVLAALGDRYALHERQVMIGRLLFAIIIGQMLGSAASGILTDAFGWRSPLGVSGLLCLGAMGAAVFGFKAAPAASAAQRAAQASITQVYATIFRNPKSVWLYGAVAVEGLLFFGCFPYMGQLLVERTGAAAADVSRETGLVLGAVGVGGLAYSLSVRMLLTRLGVTRMSLVGSVITALCFVGVGLSPIWWLSGLLMAVAGMSFFMLHSSMQTEATELVPSARASAVALFACGFFAGQGIGPLWFGLLSHSLGFPGAFILSAVGFLVLGQVAARKVVTR